MVGLSSNSQGSLVSTMEVPESAAENQFWNAFLDERDEILTLKRLESQKAGQDIGFERGIQLWLEHRDRWREAHRSRSG